MVSAEACRVGKGAIFRLSAWAKSHARLCPRGYAIGRDFAHPTCSSPLRAQQPAALALPAALLLGLALVVQLLAAGERQLHLGAPLLVEIELDQHERHA